MLKKLTKSAAIVFVFTLVLFSSIVAYAANGAPAFTSATYNVGTGVFEITGANMVSVTGKANDIQLSKVIVTDSMNHSYTLKSKSEINSGSTTTATIKLGAAEQAALSAFLDKDGTKAQNGGNYAVKVYAGWNGSTSKNDFSAHVLTVSGVATIDSATYDMTTGKLVVTGTNFASVSGSKNDIVPKSFTISDGASNVYTLTSTGVEKDSATQATITLNAADQAALQHWINKNGTSTNEDNDYQFTTAYGWNGAQAAQMAVHEITVSNYATPIISINASSSITIGAAITSKSTGISLSKPGYVYIVPSTADLTGLKKGDLDALAAAGAIIKGEVSNVSKISIATTGKTVAFKLNGASISCKLVAADYAGALSAVSANTLTINNVPAAALTGTAAAGSAVDTTKVVVTKTTTGNTLAYKVSAKVIDTPKTAEVLTLATDVTPVVDSIYAYTSGSDIANVSPTNKYVGIYEIDPATKKVVKFKAFTLASTNIKAPGFKSASVIGKTLTLVTDTLSTSSIPAAKSFTVKKGTTVNVVTKVEIASDGKSVILTLTNAVASGDTITVSYSVPTTGYLVDPAGNAVKALASTALTVKVNAVAPALAGASIADNPGDDSHDGEGIITLPATGTFKYNIPAGAYTAPYLGDDVTAWTTVANNASIKIGDNAAAANLLHVLVAEVDASNHVVSVADIDVANIADYVPGDAPAITTATIADMAGSGTDGQGVITLSAPTGTNTYVWKLKVGADTLPKLEDVASDGWTAIESGDTIDLGDTAAEANAQVVFVAEIDGSNLVVAASSIDVSGIADYVEADALAGVELVDKVGTDDTSDGYGVITVPTAEGNTFAYKVLSGTYSIPGEGDVVTTWTAVASGDAKQLGTNAADANGKHLVVIELDATNHVVGIIDIAIDMLVDYADEPKEAPAIEGASISDPKGVDNDGWVQFNLPDPTGEDTYAWKLKGEGETLPKLRGTLADSNIIADGLSVELGENAAAANGKVIFVAEIDGDSKVVKASEITVAGIFDAANELTDVTITDALGTSTSETNNGNGILNLPAADGEDTFVYKIYDDDHFTLPAPGTDVSEWSAVVNHDTITISDVPFASLANGKYVVVAEVDGDGLVVKTCDIQVDAIKDYVAAKGAVLAGTITFADDQAMIDAINGVDHTFTVKDGDDDIVTIVISSTITTRGSFQAAIRNALAGSKVYTANPNGTWVECIESAHPGSSSTLVIDGDYAPFFGTPTIIPGVDAKN